MKKIHLSIILILIVIFSCNNPKKDNLTNKEKTPSSLNNKIDDHLSNQPIKKYQQRDYSYEPKIFLLEIIDDLNNYKNEQGKIISIFLNHYDKIIEKYNNTKIDEINSNPNNFSEFFNPVMGEGDYYLIKKPEFILQINDYLSPKHKTFLKAYSFEFKEPVLDDAMITVTNQELINRAYIWGEYSKQLNNNEIKKIAKEYFEFYLNLIFFGSDNSPSFSHFTNKYNNELYNLLLRATIKHPKSEMTKYLKEFADLLEKNDLTKNENINNYKVKIQ